MTPTDLEQARFALEAIQTGGVVFLLAAGILAFVRGIVVPRNVLDSAMDQHRQSIQALVTELQAGIRQAVKDGIMDADNERQNRRRGGVV